MVVGRNIAVGALLALAGLAACGLDVVGSFDGPTSDAGEPVLDGGGPEGNDIVIPAPGTVTYGTSQTGVATDSTTVAVESVAPSRTNLYLATVSFKPYVEVRSVAGLGLTWTRVAAQCGARRMTGVEVWHGAGAVVAGGPVTATLAKAAQSAAIAVSQYAGARGVGTPVSANTNGVGGACTDNSDTDDFTIPIPAPSTGAVIFGAVAHRSTSYTPGVGSAQRAHIRAGASGEITGLTLFETAPPPMNGSFESDVDWAVIGVELTP